jgi:hypothetical protein
MKQASILCPCSVLSRQASSRQAKRPANIKVNCDHSAEYTFHAGLSNHDRAVVHAECKKYGLTSKSHGCAQIKHATERQTFVSLPKFHVSPAIST